jgi:hypothetical protein
MNRVLVLCLLSFALLAGGCADPLEQGDVQEAGQRFQQGLSGQGHLTPGESTNNPTGVPAGSKTAPEYPPE